MHILAVLDPDSVVRLKFGTRKTLKGSVAFFIPGHFFSRSPVIAKNDYASCDGIIIVIARLWFSRVLIEGRKVTNIVMEKYLKFCIKDNLT